MPEYWCPECTRKPYKTSWHFRQHLVKKHSWSHLKVDNYLDDDYLELIKLEPGPGAPPASGDSSSPAPDVGVKSQPKGDSSPGVSSPGDDERGETSLLKSPGSGAPTIEEMFLHLAQQIDTLGQNDQVLSRRLDQVQGTHYEAIVNTENPPKAGDNLGTAAAQSWSFDWDGIPDDWKKVIFQILGDLGAAGRAAFNAEPRGGVKPKLGDIIAGKLEEQETARLEARAQQIVDAIGADTRLYTEEEAEEMKKK